MKAIPAKAKPLLYAQAIVLILTRLTGRERNEVAERAKRLMKKYKNFHLLLDLEDLGQADINLYSREAVEVLQKSGIKYGEAHELLLEYRTKIAGELGVRLIKDGVVLGQDPFGKEVPCAS